MKTECLNYSLPDELIAQTPVEPRDQSRMMVVNMTVNSLRHSRFCEISEFLRQGDVLVLNDTKVIPARVRGFRKTGGQVEFLLLERVKSDRKGQIWKALARPAKKLKTGEEIRIGCGRILTITAEFPGGIREVSVSETGDEWMTGAGQMPLPPYIHNFQGDPARYQTVFASHPGAVAAPTAGLHFTPALLRGLSGNGVEIAHITLHVGLGTFKEIDTPDVEDYKLHEERFVISPESARTVNRALHDGRRIIACGTTSCRVLEANFRGGGIEPGCGTTGLYIRPGYRFKVVGALITNFHLPRTTLLLLVSALAGWDRIAECYQEAIKLRYRFFSFGDAMLIC
ncbi:MAG: tRNA preQ1(34) S-adenosylmethionine ribosyltransferase-isomerase QueA [Candidatus Wallbacteria bacterium]|nr:tRNA preQ1(34) S-adenosylmethionine ribosyltransferase-isomerase QueA [Candidatus Wallbacteria bacterium]